MHSVDDLWVEHSTTNHTWKTTKQNKTKTINFIKSLSGGGYSQQYTNHAAYPSLLCPLRRSSGRHSVALSKATNQCHFRLSSPHQDTATYQGVMGAWSSQRPGLRLRVSWWRWWRDFEACSELCSSHLHHTFTISNQTHSPVHLPFMVDLNVSLYFATDRSKPSIFCIHRGTQYTILFSFSKGPLFYCLKLWHCMTTGNLRVRRKGQLNKWSQCSVVLFFCLIIQHWPPLSLS